MNPTLERIQRGRILLLLDEPFFGSLLMHLKPVVNERIPTFSTDGKSLHINPAFCEQLNDRQLKTILAHEVMHCALLHPYRRGQRDHRQFNIAADYAINNFLDAYNQHATKRHEAAPFTFDGPLVGGCLNHAYDGLCAEEIYNLLPKGGGGGGVGQGNGSSGGASAPASQGQPGKGQPGQGQGKGQPGQGQGQLPPEASSPGEFTDGATDEASQQEAEAEWKVALQQAAAAGKSRGRLPAEIERLVGEFLEPKVHWRELLRRFLTAVARDDYSFAKPNRRYGGGRIILPGLHSPKLGKIVCAVDTSGSIDQKQFDEFMAEVRAVFFDCRPEVFVVAQCDAHLHDWQELAPFDDLQITMKGGGGTSFRPVFDRAIAETEPPAALIYLTDLEGSFPNYTPPFPVLWAVSGKQTNAPFGEVLNVL